MKKSTTIPILLLLFLMCFTIQCKKNSAEPSPTAEILFPSQLYLSVDGTVQLDTIVSTCYLWEEEKMNTSLEKITSPMVAHYQGGLELEKLYDKLAIQIHILDVSDAQATFSPIDLREYIKGVKQGIIIPEIRIVKDGIVYQSIWYEDTGGIAIFENEPSDLDAKLDITAKGLLTLDCADGQQILLIRVEYAGYLKNKSGTERLKVDNLTMEFGLWAE